MHKNLVKIENLARKAWPANVEKSYGEWFLRAHHGVSKRANSVFTIGTIPKKRDWLSDIELFYEAHKIIPCFYISDISPTFLLERLKNERSYRRVSEVSIMGIERKKLMAVNSVEHPYNMRIDVEPSLEWMDAFIRLEGHAQEDRDHYKEIFNVINLDKAFISLYKENEIIALATLAGEDAYAYLSNLVVDRRYRRQGLASELLRSLAVYAEGLKIDYMFFHVLKDNLAAIELYHKLGFIHLSSCHYQIKIKHEG